MKSLFLTLIGTIGSLATYLFGGWDAVVITLFIFMAVDFITGLIVAGVFHKSTKTESGALESRSCFKGLCRKAIIVFFVLIGHMLDITLGIDFVRNLICYAYMANELLSIIENAGLMGIPIPKVITNAVEILKSKGGEGESGDGGKDLF